MVRRVFAASLLLIAAAGSARAQSGTSGTSTATNTPSAQPASSSSAVTQTEDTRPATTTFFGDTGIWFVPTAEVLGSGKWSASAYRRGTNYVQGFTNVGDFAGTVAVGIGGRVEIFGSFLFDTRIDRDLRPLFNTNTTIGGVNANYPFDKSTWTGDKIGDLYLGGKINLWSQARQNPAALAVRAIVKVPTGDKTAGVSTGKTDGSLDLVLSKEVARKIELSGYAGYELRGQPSGVDSPSGAVRWGAGTTFPSRAPLRGLFEISGIIPSSDTVTLTGAPLVADDNSVAPSVSSTENLTRATAGLTFQAKKGFFLGAGVSWNVPMKSRDGFIADSDPSRLADYFDWQFRIGYHPGVHVYVPPPPAPPPPPPPPPVAQNRPPTVRAQCDPCSVEVGKQSTVTATAQDPDGDVLTYRWTAPTGTLASPAERQSLWTAPMQEGPVPVTITVNDGKGGTASDMVTIQVTRPPVKNYTFEDVHFDFDRYTLRPEATRLLDDAVAAMRDDASLRIEIEGHTCNIGTAEYNLALGDRRANAVRDYLVSRGVTADRLRTVSYGEERPKYDNSKEETRRLNRRAALVVNVTR
ncbi:MAG TPA: OmpA family protein [Vicinamibacterales bacterium]|jgi:outer membrane protein OmpA-like peptidoglycan-associated protein|nr:OmpA family protein [Vicinamibacterales bacterium]